MFQQHRGPSEATIEREDDPARGGVIDARDTRPASGAMRIQDGSNTIQQSDLGAFHGMAVGIGLSLPVWVLVGIVTWWVLR